MMDMNNNDFFGDIKKDEFEDENISGSGINYGETPNKSSIKTILIAIGAGAIVAGIFVLLLGPNNNTKPNNYAEIPTISSPSEPIKIIPEDEKLNEVFQNASVYNPTDFDAEAQKLMTGHMRLTVIPERTSTTRMGLSCPGVTRRNTSFWAILSITK